MLATADDDPHGRELPDHQASHAYAHRIIRELKEDNYRPPGATMIVLDQAGNTVNSISFNLATLRGLNRLVATRC